jgi:hypothetical protein
MSMPRIGAGFLALSVLVAFAATGASAVAADASATPGLPPQFGKWPVPFYASHVQKTLTWAASSYEIDTCDSIERVLGWYRALASW